LSPASRPFEPVAIGAANLSHVPINRDFPMRDGFHEVNESARLALAHATGMVHMLALLHSAF
jgi:hypothetical protein